MTNHLEVRPGTKDQLEPHRAPSGWLRRPSQDWHLVWAPLKQASSAESGLIIPQWVDTYKPTEHAFLAVGLVLARGTGECTRERTVVMPFDPGDWVEFEWQARGIQHPDDAQFVYVRATAILAGIPEPAEVPVPDRYKAMIDGR